MENKILFLGDVFLPRQFVIRYRFDVPYLINLESPITNNNETSAPENVNLKVSHCYLKKTFGYNPIAVNLANNHMLDYGEKGFFDTVNLLTEEKIPYFGVGSKKNNYKNPLILKIGNKCIALFAYCYKGPHENYYKNVKTAPIVKEKILEDITSTKGNVDKIIVNLHWGLEQKIIPDLNQIIASNEIIESGADLIISHHSHVVQPIVLYQNKWIAYGLGNFIFPDFDFIKVYNKEGKKLIKKSRKIQTPWNKSSLGLLYDLDKNKIKREYYYFNGKEVEKKKTIFHIASNLKINKVNHKKFLKIQKLKDISDIFYKTNFFKKPKWPTRGILKKVIQISKGEFNKEVEHPFPSYDKDYKNMT